MSLKSEGRKSIVWILDYHEFIREYLYDGKFDGVLSNYIPLVAYYHYTR